MSERPSRDSCHYSTPRRERSYDWPEHIEKVLTIVRPHAEEVRRFCREPELAAAVHLVATLGKGSPIGSPAERTHGAR